MLQVEGVQPMVTIEDCVEAEEIVKADPGVRALLKDRYGLTDMALVAADPWYYGDRYGSYPFHIFHVHSGFPCSLWSSAARFQCLCLC